MLFCNRKFIFDHFCYRYGSACMLQNTSFMFINTKNCSKIWLCLRNRGNEEEANKFELFLRRTLGSNITKEDNLLIEQINSFYNDKIEKEKNERHDVLEVLQNIPKQPTTKNEYNIYPQPNSQNFYGADMKGVQIRALSPSAIPQNQKLMNHKRENNNEQKNK